MKERFSFEIRHEGTNGIKRIKSYGNDILECLENMLDEIEHFKNQYENNNWNKGGNCAFTKDEDNLYANELNGIIEDINKILEN